MRKLFPILLLFALTAGCGAKDLLVRAESEEPTVIHPNPPDQLSMREVKWNVLNREELEQLLEENPDQKIVLFTLSAKGYENLSLNMQEVIRYIQDQKGIILYYRRSFPNAESSESSSEEQDQ